MSIATNKTFKNGREFVSSTLPIKIAVPIKATAIIKITQPNIPQKLVFSLLSLLK